MRNGWRRKPLLGLAGLALIGLFLAWPGIASALFDGFEAYPVGTLAEGVTLPGGTMYSDSVTWVVQENTGDYVLLSGHILQETGACYNALYMRFDEIQHGIELAYGIDPSVLVLKLDGWIGVPGPGTLVFSESLYGTWLGSPVGMREGIASVHTDFDYIVMYSPGGCAAIDDLFVEESGGVMLPIPETARGGLIIKPTPAYWAPEKGAATDVILEPGTTVWALGPDESDAFFKIIFAEHYLWVPADCLAPNPDEVWNSSPLPVDPVE